MATWSREVFAKNLNRYMQMKNITQKELAEIIGVSAPTMNDWIKARKYPRIDKVEMLANYFGILKSDLIEDKGEERIAEIQKHDTIADVVIRLRTDDKFMEATTLLHQLDGTQMDSIIQMLKAFVK